MNILQELRYGLRSLRQRPTFAVAAILTLALGVGATAAVFSVVHTVLLRPLPLAGSERIAMIWGKHPDQPVGQIQVSAADFADWRRDSRTFESLSLLRPRSFNLVSGGEAERVVGAFVSSGFFDVLGIEPLLGRSFTVAEELPGEASNVVILSHAVWVRRFGADPKVLGSTLPLQGETLTVVGILPPAFELTRPLWGIDEGIDLWLPIGPDPSRSRGARWLWALGRLRPGVSLNEAQTEMDALNHRLEQAYPETNTGWGVRLEGAREAIVADVRPSLWICFGFLGLTLLIACANVANLILARGLGRRTEMAVRSALGAGRSVILRLLFLEGLILSLMAAAGGLLFAFAITRMLVHMDPAELPRLEELTIDGAVVAFTLLVALVTTLASALVPAVYAARADLVDHLRAGGRGSAGPGGQRFRNLLVIAEIAVTLVLLTGAGLLLQSFAQLRAVDAGFRPERVLSMTTVPSYEYRDREQVDAYISEVLEKLRALPGVESAGEVNALPFSGHDGQTGLVVEGRPPSRPGEKLSIYFRAASPGYVETLGIPLIRGRTFGQADVDGRVALVNETAATRFWPGLDPVARRVRVHSEDDWLTVIGVVGDVHHSRLDQGAVAEIYVPYPLDTFRSRTFVVRSAVPLERLIAPAVDAVRSVNPLLPLFEIGTLEELIAGSIDRQRFVTFALNVLTAIAMVLAAIGVYSLVSYSISRRWHEIGVRMALGARARDVGAMISREGLAVLAVGVLVGLGGAAGLTRYLSSLLFELEASNPVAFTLGTVIIAGVVCLAIATALTKVRRIHPGEVLHHD